MLHTTSYTA